MLIGLKKTWKRVRVESFCLWLFPALTHELSAQSNFTKASSQVGSLPKKAKKVAKYIRSKEDCLGKGNESQKD
jgi:hypothetical protein